MPNYALDASDAWLVEGELARLDRYGQPVLAWRQWAAPRVVVGAVRVIGAVEIGREAAVADRLRLDITARTVRLLPARRVAERDEEPLSLREREEAHALAADVEPHRAGAWKVVRGSVAHFDLFDRAAPLGVDGDRETECLVFGEIAQALEVRPLVHRERRVVLTAEVLIL